MCEKEKDVTTIRKKQTSNKKRTLISSSSNSSDINVDLEALTYYPICDSSFDPGYNEQSFRRTRMDSKEKVVSQNSSAGKKQFGNVRYLEIERKQKKMKRLHFPVSPVAMPLKKRAVAEE